jgi:hypothetical protein
LIGTWRLDFGGEVFADNTISFATREFTAHTCDQDYHGTWATMNGAIVAQPEGYPDCPNADMAGPMFSWLTAAATVVRDGDGWGLLDSDGERTVGLVPVRDGDAPRPVTPPPVLDDEARQWLAPPAPLPAGLAEGDVTGRWESAGGSLAGVILEFWADGWNASDDCGEIYGRWAPPEGGGLLATTLVVAPFESCDVSSLTAAFADLRLAGFDGETLVLLDGDAKEIGRFLPADDPMRAVDLLGLWLVDVEGLDEATSLFVGPGYLALTNMCGSVSFTWLSVGSEMVASAYSGHGCLAPGEPAVGALERSVTFEKIHDGWQFTDRDGTVTATMREPEGTGPQDESYPLDEPQRALLRARHQAPHPLPRSLDSGSVAGTWAVQGASSIELAFTADGTWSMSHCADAGGRWRQIGDVLLLSPPPVEQAQCVERATNSRWSSEARLAGFDRDTLVLLDAYGAELARFGKDT